MDSDRMPGSLRSGHKASSPIETQRKEPWTSRMFAAACLMAASPVTLAIAQETSGSSTLPPLSVEAKAAKKKAAAKKSAPAPQAPAPVVEPAADETPPLPGQAGPPPPGSYKADYASSPKMTAPLLNTPQTVTVVPGTVIQERAATNLTETLRNTPGISFNAGENAFSASPNNFQIRGFDTSGNIFVDGVRDSGSFARDMFNVDRVEVIKGPAADNGRGGAGGYINIVTKTPLMENFVAGDLTVSFDEYGTDPHVRSTVDVNQRSGTVGVRLNGMIEDGGVMGRDVAELEAYGIAPSITFGLGTDFRAIFSYERLERQDLPDWGVPAHMIKGMMRFDPVAARADRDNFYGLSSDFDDVQGDAALARFEYDLSPNFVLSNQTRWSETDRLSRFTFPNGFTPGGTGGTVTTNTQFYDRVNTSVSNLTNLAGTFVTGSLKHTISTGIDYSHEESDANRQNQVANVGGAPDIFDPDPNRAPGPLFNPAQRSAVEIDTIAGYVYDTIELTRQLQLTGGLRVEHYKVDIDSRTILGAPIGLDNGKFEESETTLGGKIGLVYKPVEDGSLYISYGASALPPGSYLSNPDISRQADDAFPGLIEGAGPIEMRNYEAGVKWDFFGGALTTTAALFRTEKDTHIKTRLSDTIWDEEQVVQGLELGIAGSVTDRWKVFGGLTWLESERNHSAALDAELCEDRFADYGAPNAADCPGRRTDGDELAFTPEFFLTLWTTYDVTDKFTLGGGVQYVSESWLGRPDDALRIIKNGVFGKLPDYFVVNLMASYDLTENIDLQLNVDNVFDELYAVSSNWPGQRAILGAPRTFRIGTSFEY